MNESIQPIMRSPAMDAFIRNVVAADRPRELVAVDSAVVGSWSAPPKSNTLSRSREGTGSSQM